ncbi:hypothetical protein A2U01_0015467, partial [Trifolium medium]|nr:hypothetical protein [Trifolium medium]
MLVSTGKELGVVRGKCYEDLFKRDRKLTLRFGNRHFRGLACFPLLKQEGNSELRLLSKMHWDFLFCGRTRIFF